ncbi:MAG: DUF1653 domain-containing protein [Patescibacteria group bacterium]
MNIKPGIYKHSKTGNMYRLHFVAKNSENLEDFVIYEALYDNEKSKFWARPVSMWSEEVEVDGIKKPRFVYVGE